MKELIIIGTGGFARECYYLACHARGFANEFTVKGFLEGDLPASEELYRKLPLAVVGNVADYPIKDSDVFVCAIANPQHRKKFCSAMEDKGAKFINLISNKTVIAQETAMGVGNIISFYTLISCNVSIGNHVIVNTSSGIGHDSKLGDYTTLSAYCDITGNVSVGAMTMWGSGSRVLPGSIIEDGAFIGAGSVVLKRVKKGKTVFGIPAVEI